MLVVKEETDGKRIEFKSIRSMIVVNDLINVFNQYIGSSNKHFILDFTRLKSQSFPPSLVSIAGISDYYRENYNYIIEFETKKGKYFSHTSTSNPKPVSDNGIPLIHNIFDQVITFSGASDVEFISSSIMNYLKTHILCEEGVLIALSWCMNEIMDNVLCHSNVNKGYFMSQIHKENKLISISIYDNGIGLLNSINSSNVYNETTDSGAIEKAIERGVTCNPNIGQGNGLWGLYEIVKSSGGYMTIKTGTTKYEFDFQHNKLNKSINNSFLSTTNKSTRVDFTLKFNKLIDIYNALDSYTPYESISRDIDDMTIDTGWIDFKLKDKAINGTGTRKAGEELRISIINVSRVDSNPILIDFDEIDYISSSFADEFIGKLIYIVGREYFCNRYKIINANEVVIALLNKAITQRNG